MFEFYSLCFFSSLYPFHSSYSTLYRYSSIFKDYLSKSAMEALTEAPSRSRKQLFTNFFFLQQFTEQNPHHRQKERFPPLLIKAAILKLIEHLFVVYLHESQITYDIYWSSVDLGVFDISQRGLWAWRRQWANSTSSSCSRSWNSRQPPGFI